MKLSKLAVLSFFVFSSMSHAGIKDDMNSFFDGTVNYTSPDAVNGQMGGYYNGGSFQARVPVRNVNMATVNLPKFGGGCSGIDSFFGAFSMVSSEQLTALAKAIAQNGGSFAFDLALSTLSPVIAEKVQQLRELVNMLNQFQINSCEQATAAVAAMWPWASNEGAQSAVCKSLGRRRGLFTDAAAERYQCDNRSQAPSIANQANSDSEFKDVVTLNSNLVWRAFMRNGLFTSDKSTAQTVMTLTGTVINKNTGSRPEVKIFSPRFNNPADFKALLEGGRIEGALSCDELSDCLSPTDSTVTTISASESFAGKIKDHLVSMRNKAVSGDALSNAEKNLISATTIPVYKMLLVDAAYNRGTGSTAYDYDSLAQMVAVDVLYNYLEDLIGTVRRTVNTQFAATSEPKVRQWAEDLQQDLTILHLRKAEASAKTSQSFDVMQKTMQLEKYLASRTGSQINSVFTFAQALK